MAVVACAVVTVGGGLRRLLPPQQQGTPARGREGRGKPQQLTTIISSSRHICTQRAILQGATRQPAAAPAGRARVLRRWLRFRTTHASISGVIAASSSCTPSQPLHAASTALDRPSPPSAAARRSAAAAAGEEVVEEAGDNRRAAGGDDAGGCECCWSGRGAAQAPATAAQPKRSCAEVTRGRAEALVRLI